jgi:hypothetical protein
MEKGPTLIPIFKKKNSVPKPSNTVKPINIVETVNEVVQEKSTESFNEITGLLNERPFMGESPVPAPFKGSTVVDTKSYTKDVIFGSLRNTYPFDKKDSSNAYQSSGNSIKYNGKFKGNSIEFASKSHKDVNVLSNSSFRFIINFVDTNGNIQSKWTSDKFKRELDAYYNSTNPYFNIDSVTVMQLPTSLIGDYAKSSKFSIPEEYAQVEITDTITTSEEILRYIDYLVDNTTNEIQEINANDVSTMDVDTYDEISAGILDNSININEKLGFSLQDKIDEQIESGASNDTRITTNNPIPPITTNTVSKSERTTVIPPPPTFGGRKPERI